MLLRRIFPDSIVGLLAGLAFAASFLFTVFAVDSSQRQICHRQQATSIATPYLISSMDEIHQLLTLPRDKRQPPESEKVKTLVDNLNSNLATFVRIERSQPRIHC